LRRVECGSISRQRVTSREFSVRFGSASDFDRLGN
jgi:hypothetical protein